MKHLKRFNSFNEDATANSSTSGMGAVVSSQPGTFAGTTGTEGSGDIGFTFKKEKREKGKPSEVSDLRDLEEEDINKIEEVK